MLSCARRVSCGPGPAEGVVAKEDDGVGFVSCCACRSLWLFLSVTVFFVDGIADLEENVRGDTAGRLLNDIHVTQMIQYRCQERKRMLFVLIPLLFYV